MKNWEKLHGQAIKMLGDAKASLYDRGKVLSQVFDDPEFKADMAKQGRRPTQVLDAALTDTFVDFTELNGLLKVFPKRADWKNGDLRSMREALIKHLGDRKKQHSAEVVQGNGDGTTIVKTPGSDQKLSWKQKYLEMEQRYIKLEARYSQLEADHRHLQESLGMRKQTA